MSKPKQALARVVGMNAHAVNAVLRYSMQTRILLAELATVYTTQSSVKVFAIELSEQQSNIVETLAYGLAVLSRLSHQSRTLCDGTPISRHAKRIEAIWKKLPSVSNAINGFRICAHDLFGVMTRADKAISSK